MAGVNFSQVMEKKMNKIFSVLLLVTFSFGIISCSNSEDSSGATSQLGQVLDQPNSTDDRNSIDLPVKTFDSCYLIDSSTIDNSTVDKSSISDNSSIKDSTVNNCSTVTRAIVDNSSTIDYSKISYSTINSSYICAQSTIDNSTIDNATVCNSSTVKARSIVRARSIVDNSSTIDNSTISYSTINNSLICVQSTIDNSTIDNATVCNSSTVQGGSTVRNNSSVCNSTIDNATIDNSTVCYDNVSFSIINKTILNQIMTEQTDPILVDNVSITSATEETYTVLNTDDIVSVTATFSEPVIVTDDDGIGVDNASGTPTLTIKVGSINRTATYASTIDNSTIFQYTIQAGDNDTDGISIEANSLALNSGTIRDASGNYALALDNGTFVHSLVEDNDSYMVDTTVPNLVIDNVSIISSDDGSTLCYVITLPTCTGWSLEGHVIALQATFSENVIVTGTPQLKIKIVNTERRADYNAAASGGKAMVFKYTILANNIEPFDNDGIRIDADSLILPSDSDTIKDAAGNVAIIDHNSTSDNGNFRVK
jgi:hypothetical protein